MGFVFYWNGYVGATPFLQNWLFSGSPRGAKASVILYSLIETAKANKLEPGTYLKHLFENLPKARSENALISLLPQNIKMSNLDR